MTKSTITRERLEWLSQISCRDDIEDIGGDEIRELASMALSALDSESGCLPLDYLQGHKDGLEWASQLAEANHPETGDWLYDDPIELAKAIRKGPDMPPEQPVEDSEPDRNPVLAYADSYRDMAKQGVESVPIWSVITDLERNIAPLYRHAQPEPVVSAELLHTAASAIEDLLTTKDRTGACVWFDLPFRLRSAANAQPVPVVPDEIKHRIGGLDWGWEGEFNRGWNACRAAMLQASPVCTCPSGDGSLRWPCPVHPGNSPAQSDCCPAQNHVSPAQNSVAPAQSPIDHGYRPECECSGCKATARICAELSANSSANPDCWCRTCRPVVLNDMRFVVCPDCGNKRCPRANDHRNSCTGSNEPGQEGSAYPDTPQSPCSKPATVPGKWIPVSERMPDENAEQQVLACFKGGDISTLYYFEGRWDDAYGIVPIRQDVTHWMPLPAAPQEVK